MDYFDGLSIALVGSHPKNQSLHRNQPRYYGIQYNHSGGLYLRVNRQTEYRVTGSWAFITYPGPFFEYGPLDQKPRWHCYVCFYGPRVEQYLGSGLLRATTESPLIHIANPGRFLETIETLKQGIASHLPNPARQTHTLEDLLLQLHEQDGDSRNLPYHGAEFATLIDEIDRHPERPWNLVEEARHLGLSATHFRRLFRQFVGLSPQQYLIQRRLRLAAELLTETDDLVRQVANQTGFHSEFYFSRLFKQTYDLAPLEYRREFAATRL